MPALAQAIAAVPVPFDEMSGTDGLVRAAYAGLKGWLDETAGEVLDHRRREAEVERLFAPAPDADVLIVPARS